MDYGIPAAWSNDGRGFWTRRRRSAISLITVLTLIAGAAIAYKMFDKDIPNNIAKDASTFDYEVFKMEDAAGDSDFVNTEANGGTPIFAAGVEHFPGDLRYVDVKIHNTNENPEKDASFFFYVEPDIEVTGCVASDGSAIPVDDAGNCEPGATTSQPIIIDPQLVNGFPQDFNWNRFVGYWRLVIDKQRVLNVNGNEVNEDDHTGQNVLNPNGDPDESGNRQYRPLNPGEVVDPDNEDNDEFANACTGGLREFPKPAPCNLGIVRAFGTRDALGEQTDLRYYKFGLRELEDNFDQSVYRGWTLDFDIVFQARVPALPEPTTPVYERP